MTRAAKAWIPRERRLRAPFSLVRRAGRPASRAGYANGMNGPPVLETRRLLLRPPTHTDADRIRRLAGDRRIADTTESIPHPYPEGVAERWIADRETAWREHRTLALAVTRREGAALLGVVSLEAGATGQAELGYWIGVDYWGRGYATEAASALLDHGFDVLGLRRVNARCLARNPASARVIVRLGFRHVERQRDGTVKWGRPEDVDVYRLDRPRPGPRPER